MSFAIAKCGFCAESSLFAGSIFLILRLELHKKNVPLPKN